MEVMASHNTFWHNQKFFEGGVLKFFYTEGITSPGDVLTPKLPPWIRP